MAAADKEMAKMGKEAAGDGDQSANNAQVPDDVEKRVDTHSHHKLGNLAMTGYFRDGVRRVDLVLVFLELKAGSRVEAALTTFMSNVLDMGLNIEMEQGVEKVDYGFAKIHAPDKVLKEYAVKMNKRKYFKGPHLALTKGVGIERDLIATIREHYSGTFSTFERSRLTYNMLMPLAFGGSSSYVGLHSLLKNKIVLSAYPLHDGPYFMLRGQDPLEIQGRQALFYNWVGYRNLFKSQPIHLIQEYLGERVAFFFAFYEYYNRALLILSLFGVLAFLGGFYDDDSTINTAGCTKYSHAFSKWYTSWKSITYTYTKTHRELLYTYHKKIKGGVNFACDGCRTQDIYKWDRTYPWGRYTYEGQKYYYCYFNSTYTATKWSIEWDFRNVRYVDMPVCAKCRDFEACPSRNLTDYCGEVSFKTFLDNPHVLWLLVLVAVWGIVLNITWRRRERYLAWIWEIPLNADKMTLMPDYWPRWMMQMRRCRILRTVLSLIFRIAILAIFASAYIFGVIPLLVAFHDLARKMTLPLEQDWYFLHKEYVIMIYLGGFNAFIIILLERLCRFLCRLAVGLQNNSTEYKYEYALALRWSALSFLVNFGLIYFYGLLKGKQYTYPSDPNRWYWPVGLGIANCGLVSCIDEVFFVFLGTFVFKTVFQEFAQIFVPSGSEYRRPICFWRRSKAPCWEKEMGLYALEDSFIMSQYQRLMLQFAISTFFMAIFPLAPMCTAILNIWHIRHLAHWVLLSSRRPLIVKNWGLGAWRNIFACLPYLAALSNIMLFAMNTSKLEELHHNKNFNTTRFFVDYTMGAFNTTDYSREPGGSSSPAEAWRHFQRPGVKLIAVDFCLFPAKYNRYVTSYKDKRVQDNAYVPLSNEYHTTWQKGMIIFVMMNLVMILAAFIRWAIRTYSAHIEEVREKEEIVRNYIIRTSDTKKTT